MLSRIRGLSASTFARAVATLAAGQGLAAVIPMVTAPVLGRLYGPEDYGTLAAYMAYALIFAGVSSLQLHQGIIAERSEVRAIGLVSACLAVSGIVALISVLFASGLYFFVRDDPEWAGLAAWLFLLPVTTFAAGATSAIASLANRRTRYGFMARVQVGSVLIATALSVTLGYLGAGAQGLFTAYFLQQLIILAAHIVLLRTIPDFRLEVRPRRLFAIAWTHRRFAYFTLPTEFVSNFSQSLPIFALSALDATATLGAFNRARQLIMLPVNLLGASIGQVFRQRAAVQYHETGTCRPLYARTFLMLLATGVLPMLILMAIAPELFRIVLGPKWVEAGQIARLLAPMLLFRLVVSPLTSVFYFARGQVSDLLLMTIGTAGTSLVVWFAIQTHWAATR